MKSLTPQLLIVTAFVLSSCGEPPVDSKLNQKTQYTDSEGHAYCKTHDMRLVEIDGFIPAEILQINPTKDFDANHDLYPNHLTHIHCSLTRSDTFSQEAKLRFCIICDEGFNSGMNQKSELLKQTEQVVAPDR